jgi:hypothetical protein
MNADDVALPSKPPFDNGFRATVALGNNDVNQSAHVEVD